MTKSFSDFLEEKYIEEEHPLDDHIADGFPDWYSTKEIEDISNYANEWKQKD